MASTDPKPDLHSQFESLLHAIREAEADWRFTDRLDLALGLPSVARHGPVDGAWTPPKEAPPWSPGSPKT